MGMSDQYDDGRYDGIPEEEMDDGQCFEHGSRCPDISPELNFVRAHPFTVERGGIKYPTPKKETPMTERLTKAQIDHELKLNTELINTLQRSRAFLQKQLATALPAEPPVIYVAFSVGVRFKMRGKRYTFLILRSGKQYFTTGTSPAHNRFDSWEQLCEWLEGPDVYDHTDLEILKPAGRAVSFDTGAVQAVPTGASPF